MNWADLISQPPSYEEIEQEISRLATGATHPIAQMPRPMDPDYATRLREAYTSTCVNIAAIAKGPGTIDAGMRIGYLWAQVIDFIDLIQVDREELDLDLGPKHIRARWPAIVAGRYQQLRDREAGEHYRHKLANSNAWIGGGGYKPSHAEIEAGWGNPYEGEQQVLSNPVDPGLFNVPA